MKVIRPLLMIIFPVLFICKQAFSQDNSVGLVLSGGGAKGIAHVGLIKALEENEIPIDYITGTSMGAIVGGLYAIGYSTEDMLELFHSRDFYRAYTGDLSDAPLFNFKCSETTPDFLNFTLSFKVKQMAVGVRGFALVPPAAMNISFFEIFTPAGIAADGNFNRLFVPFRCTGSDIYNKKSIIFDKGNLAYAIQVSMSIPFYFRPQVGEDNKVLLDGGIYNNLPVVPMQQSFNPSFIIATTVAESDRPPLIEDDLGDFFTNIILQQEEYELKPDNGILINIDTKEVGMMDFNKVKEAYELGYRKGLEMVDSIRLHVKRRMPEKSVQESREAYKKEIPELIFNNVEIGGVNEKQQNFFSNFFHKDKRETYTMDALKEDYLNFFAGSDGIDMIPEIKQDSIKDGFNLILKTQIRESPSIGIGANISSLNANQLYLGIRLNRFSTSAFKHKVHFYWGNHLNSASFTSDLNTEYKLPMRFQLLLGHNYFRYVDPDFSFFSYSEPIFNQRESMAKLKMSLPSYWNSKLALELGGARLVDRYMSPKAELSDTIIKKHSIYNLGKVSLNYSRGYLNNKMYPTSGKMLNIQTSYHWGKEELDCEDDNNYSRNLSYFSGSASAEKYHEINKFFTVKGYASLMLSSKPSSANYEATVIQADAFTPTPHSLVTFNKNLRANNYMAIGVTPLFKLNSTIHFRLENYYFMPFRPISQTLAGNKTSYGKAFSKNTFMSEICAVYNLPILSISVFGNYYSRAESHYNFGINIGYLIFNERFN